ncbi:hypothetical protein AWB77_05730 [Caballeronia fortuita]|uniref:Uncharacterized protein n=1 Tax=Caballeronia fortuita TaxID=1777138 RepID=A0A158DSC4_9BURK|nr:hypothetical protein [Caballeronia fortuita]SAK97522.1 hypothetical protein AWB77_05730 [Caballeronia fortuita]
MLVSEFRIGSETGFRLPRLIERDQGEAGDVVENGIAGDVVLKAPVLAAGLIEAPYHRDKLNANQYHYTSQKYLEISDFGVRSFLSAVRLAQRKDV